MQVCALIMTPLPLEYAAAIKHVGGQHEKIFKDQAVYVRGTFKGNHHDYSVVVCEPGMRNVDMALATERAIQRFSPSIVLLMGIAGGIKDLKKGDVAIASSAFNYDSGKELENQFLPRPVEFHFSKELLAYAKDISRSDDWKKRTSDGAPQANILIAPVASGDKVVAAVHNPTYDRIVQYLSHCKFLEMEAGGFGLAVQPYRDLHALVIRGISDMCAGKAETDLENWQAVAAERAAAVVFEMLFVLNASNFIQPKNMDIKTIVKETYELLFPAALKEISNDFTDAVNENIRALWRKVKPYFIEEVKELAKEPEDSDAQAAVRNKLKSAVEGDAGLKEALEGLLEKARSKLTGEQVSISVTGDNNNMSGNNMNAGGNITISDITNHRGNRDAVQGNKFEVHHHYPESPAKTATLSGQRSKPLPTNVRLKLRDLISQGQPEQALDDLVSYATEEYGQLQGEVIALSDRWQDLSRRNRNRLISYENALVERSLIVAALLEIILKP